MLNVLEASLLLNRRATSGRSRDCIRCFRGFGRRRKSMTLAITVFLCCMGVLHAQSVTGTLLGTVTDAGGAVSLTPRSP